MSSEILASVLQRMDSLNLFPRGDDLPTPFFLCDGHSSRLQLPFLEYITDSNHPWVVCLGLPNATHFWQVGDSKQQNGRCKKELVLAKRDIIRQRMKLGEPAKIESFDIIPCVARAFPSSFGDVEGNKKAIYERGWNPLNRNILLSSKLSKVVDLDTESEDDDQPPESQDSQETNVSRLSQSTMVTISKLNFSSESKSSLLIEAIHQKKIRSQAGEMELKARRKKQRLEDRQQARDLSDMHARLTAGNMVHHNIYHIGQETMNYVKNQQQKKIRKENEITSKKYRFNLKTYQDGLRIRNKDETKWTSDDYCAMIKFKQLFKDNMPPLPKSLPTKKERWQVVKYFPDPVEPTQPDGYVDDAPPVAIPVSQRGASDDELSDASLEMFQV